MGKIGQQLFLQTVLMTGMRLGFTQPRKQIQERQKRTDPLWVLLIFEKEKEKGGNLLKGYSLPDRTPPARC